MPLIKSALTLRSGSHVETRLRLREESAQAYILFPYNALIFISFALVDWVGSQGSMLWPFVVARSAVVFFARVLYLLLRGRGPPRLRIAITILSYVYTIEVIMIRCGLTDTPYFAGLALVMLAAANVFPMPTKPACLIYGASILPSLIYVPFSTHLPLWQTLNAQLMLLGTVIVSSMSSSSAFRELRERIRLSEVLTRDLGKREKEIRTKAADLLKRQTFESQFSPQVVAAVLQQGTSAIEMRQQRVVVIVIDIEHSTQKSKSLEPKAYKEVIEEVFDVFASACLKWDITVDKFTGDGAQAFSGAPVSAANDMDRALMACRDTLRMLNVRGFNLRRRWRDPVRLRISVCEGPALVGFLGRGTLKSFTAIGETVSFAHRLCAAGEPGTIVAYSLGSPRTIETKQLTFSLETRTLKNLKGFGNREFQVTLLTPTHASDDILVDNGRCEICGTPLVLDEGPSGLPKLVCPGCQARAQKIAA